MKFPILLLLMFLASVAGASAQTYAEKLGFPAGKKVIILHVDDAGMSHESNAGAINALEKGIASSVSIMMPCDWVPQILDYVKKHPNIDAGIHLALTSEWDNYRWGPLAGCHDAPGLCDPHKSLWHSVAQVVEHASAEEVETEIRAQLARYRAFGVEPTHLDSHMGTLFEPKFLMSYAKVGMEEKIPILFPGGHASLIFVANKVPVPMQQLAKKVGQQLWDAGLPVLDDLDGTSYGWNLPAGTPVTDKNLQAHKTKKYIELLNSAKPGLTYIIMHCTDATPAFDQISGSGQSRRGDMLAMMDPALKAFIEKEGIIITNWRELMERRKKIKE